MIIVENTTILNCSDQDGLKFGEDSELFRLVSLFQEWVTAVNYLKSLNSSKNFSDLKLAAFNRRVSFLISSESEVTSFSLSVQIQITSSYMSVKENHYANIPPTVCWTHIIKPHSRLDGSYAFRILIWEQCFSIMSDLIKLVTREVTHVQKTSRGAGFDFSKKNMIFPEKFTMNTDWKFFASRCRKSP